MIYFKRLIAHRFGMLHDKTLALGKGFHIIYQENETGKSTWAGLIKNLLFQIPRKGDPEYRRFSMDKGVEISMDIVIDGVEYHFYKKDMKPVSAVREPDGSKAPKYCTKEPGSVIWDIPKKTFINTLFLGQMGHMIVKDDQIEKRLARTAQNTELAGGNTFEEGIETLTGLLRVIDGRSKESKCQKLRTRKEEISGWIEDNRTIYNHIFSYERELSNLESRLAKARKSLEIKERQKLREDYNKAMEYSEKCAEIDNRCDQIKVSVSYNGVLPQKKDCECLKKALTEYKELKRQYTAVVSRQNEEIRSLDDDRTKLPEFHFFSRPDYFLQKQKAQSSNPEGNANSRAGNSQLFYVLSGISLAAGVFGTVINPKGLIIWIMLIIFAILSAVLGNIKRKKGNQLLYAQQKETSDFLFNAGCRTLEDVFVREGEYNRLKSAVEIKESILAKTAGEAEEMELRLNDQKNLFDKEPLFEGMENNEDTMLFYINQVIDRLDEMEALDREREYCSRMYQSLSRGQSFDEAACTVEVPEEAEESLEDIPMLEYRISEIREKRAIEKGKLARQDLSVGELEAQLEETDEKLKTYLYKKDVIETAIQYLKESRQIFSTRYAPQIANELGELMNELTEGKYVKAAVNHDFEILLTHGSDDERLDTARLSKGAEELAWFALRMVLSKTAYGDKEALPPVILDDPFVNFDDRRCEAAVRLLSRIAGERQVILFTCHKRMIDFAKELPEICIID